MALVGQVPNFPHLQHYFPHLQHNFPHSMAEVGTLSNLNMEEMGHQEVCPASLGTRDEGAPLN
jgi:hypothetical protein